MERNMKMTTKCLSSVIGLITCVAFFASPQLYAQNKEDVYCVTEKPPKPKGGMSAFYEYTESNLKRPEQARKQGVKGNVFVQFIVEKDGQLSNIRVIKGIGAGCDEAVVQLLEKAPKWTPGIQRGTPVRVRKTMSIQVR